ncbi:MAG TPA: tricarballylate utilization 4Fe-4S protein TcuB [Candidatus Binataceae bacterium]|nr:tricarballylate utilization 4Fe-4S protein TcuB [Candidatus Binataceae bacterium]
MFATKTLEEADRIATICNACRYCEGLCAVFPAIETKRAFVDADLTYFANLCHACGACYQACQFSPPHEFNVNLPRVLAEVRTDSYKSYAWPRAFSPIFERNGLWISVITAVSVASFLLAFVALGDPAAIFATGSEAGAFYRLMPHAAMATLFGAVFLYAIAAMTLGFRDFWRETGPARGVAGPSIWRAMRDAGELRYLGGGDDGCRNTDDVSPDHRRIYHHLTFYGFLLCFAATLVATGYHYLWGRLAPYAWYEPPVILGTLGGIGLLFGTVGLLAAKWRRDPIMEDQPRRGMDYAFTLMLFLTALTGLLLLLLRATSAMGILLALHLGVVFALFLTLPYGKFVHGLFRFGALLRFAIERQSGVTIVE